MEKILAEIHYRRLFYALTLLTIMLLVSIRYYTLPYYDKAVDVVSLSAVASLVDNFLVSVITTVFMGSFLFWVRPDIAKRSQMEVIDPKGIGPLLNDAIGKTKSWIYMGACGRFLRNVTIPKMAEFARKQSLSRDIRVLIMNPKNVRLCREYATYRRSLKSAGQDGEWTEFRVRMELLATVVAVAAYRHQEPLLRIDLHFMEHFSAFRLDISDLYVVVTKEDKEASGLRADFGTYFYESYKDDVRLAERQAGAFLGSVELKVSDGAGWTAQQFDDVGQLLVGSGLINEAEYDEEFRASLMKLVVTKADPYGAKFSSFMW